MRCKERTANNLLLRPQTCCSVRHFDPQCLRPKDNRRTSAPFRRLKSHILYLPLKDCCAVSAADVVCDLGSEGFVVHQENVNFSNVLDNELLQAVGQEMSCLFVRAVTDLMHSLISFDAE